MLEKDIYIVFGKENCPYCVKTKELLERKGISFIYKDIGKDDNAKSELFSLFPEARSVPQIFKVTEHIPGYNDLVRDIN